MPLVHHELCFGCGRTNLFGLLVEVVQVAPQRVSGRCFIKQDHQGADRGNAHDGVIAAALSEAMALAAGLDAGPRKLEISFQAPAPVGAFLELEASSDSTGMATATARADGRLVASARGTYS